MLNNEQFEEMGDIPYPYPRLRESFARNMAMSFAAPDEDNPVALHPAEGLPLGRFMANALTKVALTPKYILNESQISKNKLIEHGFRKRHETKKRYASFNN
jgi:hypothetical protein